ncbi:MAG: hypothetical protein Kow0040_15550 [Thermogutta sp.]
MSYRLQCECGRELFVDLHQAGSEIRCECSRTLLVPSRRALQSQESVTETLAESDAEDINPAVIWAKRFRAMGAAILLIAVVGAVLLFFTRPKKPTILGWTPANTYRFFRSIQGGIDGPLFNIEADYLKQVRFHAAMQRVNLLLGVLGFLLAGAASLALWFEKRTPPPEEDLDVGETDLAN